MNRSERIIRKLYEAIYREHTGVRDVNEVEYILQQNDVKWKEKKMHFHDTYTFYNKGDSVAFYDQQTQILRY